ncbi:MAG TPA: STAS domain-containing protein [Solirubrobacter sp.]|nr:STAS domain-containing protein [Solirubrobacter sp.]
MLTVVGEIDLATTAAFRDALQAAVLAVEREVWIDLTRVDFMDSTGLHALLAVRQALECDGRALTVIVPDGSVRRTIELTGLEPLLNVHSDRESANRDS